MLDSRAIINIMSKRIAWVLGLTCTSDFPPMFFMDSRYVQTLRVVKDVPVYLEKFTSKQMLMDLIIVDVESCFSILLSRYFGSTLGDTIHLDWFFSTIPMPDGTTQRLYRESCNRVAVRV